MSRQKTESILSVPISHRQDTSPSNQSFEGHVHKTLFQSKYYVCDPLNSSYSCFPCLRRKGGQISSVKKGSTSTVKHQKRNSLQIHKLEEVIVKPWHPFLRVLQGFFKSDRNKTMEKNQDNKLILEVLFCLRSLRSQLLSSQELIKSLRTLACRADQIQIQNQINDLMDENYQVLFNNSLEMIEAYFNNQNQPNTLKPVPLRVQILEQQLHNAVYRLKEAEKTIENISDTTPLTIKSLLPKFIEIKQLNEVYEKKEYEYRQELEIYNKELIQLKEENYFYYTLARLDRQNLYTQLMKKYPQNELRETDVSHFELYLQELESQLCDLRNNKAKLAAQIRRLNVKENEWQEVNQGAIEQEVRRMEDQWKIEETALYEEIQTLQAELQRAQRAEREVNGACMRMQNEVLKIFQKLLKRDSVVQQFKVLQEQLNNSSMQILQLKQEREGIIKELDYARDTIQHLQKVSEQSTQPQLEHSVSLDDSNASKEALEQLCLIILSRHERLSPEQNQLIRRCLGEQAQVIIDQYEQVLNEQQEGFNKLKEQIQQLQKENDKNLKLVKQHQIIISEVDQILTQAKLDAERPTQLIGMIFSKAIEKTLHTLRTSNPLIQPQHKSEGNLFRTSGELLQSPSSKDLIHSYSQKSPIISQTSSLPRIRNESKSTQTTEKRATVEDLNLMVLMQAIAIEEMIKTAESVQEDDNLSVESDEDVNKRKKTAKEFDVIMEQMNEEDDEEHIRTQAQDSMEQEQSQSIRIDNLSFSDHPA